MEGILKKSTTTEEGSVGCTLHTPTFIYLCVCVRATLRYVKKFSCFVTQFNSGKIPRALLNFGHEHEKASFPSNWSKNG